MKNAKKKLKNQKTFKIPTFEESLNSTNELDAIFSMLSGNMPKNKHLPLNEITPMAANFILSVGHKQCGCPGVVDMIPSGKNYICPNCHGWIAKEEVQHLLREAYEKMVEIFTPKGKK